MQSSTSITRIEPSRSWLWSDLGELWAYRELLYFLTVRDIKIRYKQTLIGVSWALLQPILTTAIFTAIFSGFSKFDSGTVPYPLFVLSALIIWLFTHGAVTISSTSFVNHANLVTKVYFPRLIVPLAATLAGLFDLIFSVSVFGVLMVYYQMPISSKVFLLPLFLALAFLCAFSFGSLFAALNVRFRDVKFALPFLLQVWMIASPVFYPVSLIPEKWQLVFALNPLTGVIDGVRSALFGEEFHWAIIGTSAASALVAALISLFVFRQMEDGFADVI